MSLVYTLDVFCDAKGCGQWSHGEVRRHLAPGARRVRRDLSSAWSYRLIAGSFYDLCSKHADVTTEEELTPLVGSVDLSNARAVPVSELMKEHE